MLSSRDSNRDLPSFNNIEEIVGPIECSDFDLDNFIFPIDDHVVKHKKKAGTLTKKELDYIDRFLKGSE